MNEQIWFSIKLSLLVSALSTVFVALIGGAIAYLLATREFRGKIVLEVLISLPLIMPPTVTGYYLIMIFGRHGFLGKLIYEVAGWSIMFTWQAAVLASFIISLPLMVRTSQAAIASFGYVCQKHALFPHMTVLKNIMFGAKDLPEPERRESARELIATLRLDGLGKKYPREISGGQQQRVAFARAIIRKPRALLLDEPFSSLDTITRVKMRACLRNIMKDLHIPVIMFTHDIFEACHVADRMLIYSAGRIVQEGAPATEEIAALTSFAYYKTLIPDGYPD